MAKHESQAYASILALHQIKTKVRLGVGQEERRQTQDVLIDVRLYLPAPPASAHNDNADYICYHALSEKIVALCAQGEYRLIEYLTHAIYESLRAHVGSDIKIAVKLTKPHIAALPYVEGGASYSFCDLPPFAWVTP